MADAALQATASAAPAWTLGEPGIDGRLGAGLGGGGVHEIRPAVPVSGRAAAGDRAAAFAFAIRLAVRRLAALPPGSPRAAVLCCLAPEAGLDIGALYGPGLAAAGLDPRRLVIVEGRSTREALWAVEEGLRATSLALVLAQVGDVALTPARRLSLAAAAHATPCLLLSPARGPGTAAVASRWRVGAAPGAAHPFDPRAAGDPAWSVRLERMPAHPAGEMMTSVTIEWCDETLRFRLAAKVADRAVGAGFAGGVARRRAAGAG